MILDIGISDINLFGGVFSLDSQSLAKARSAGDKIVSDSGFIRRAVAAPWEDSVTFAINAALPLLKNTQADQIGLLIVATESGLDYGKPISTYIHRMLNLPSNCTNFEIKHACFGGTAALQTAINWQKANPDSNKKAMVICTDLARPHLNDFAEFTSGTAAVAMIVDKNPKLILVNPERGCGTKEVYDVARPTLHVEPSDPVLSLGSYMDLLELAWQDYADNPSKQKLVFDDLDYMVYHTPLVSLIKLAHKILLENTQQEQNERYSFDSMCAPLLKYNLEVSNIYSGSLYTALIGLIEKVNNEKTAVNTGCFSYGSGACSEFYTCKVHPQGIKHLSNPIIMSQLNERVPLEVELYETFMKENLNTKIISDYKPVLSHDFEQVADLYVKNNWVIIDKVENYYRSYRNVN